MTCSDFLICHTAFYDGGLSPEDSGQCREHLEGCPACRRYDEVMIRGINLLKGMPATQPAEDFRARVQHSIYALHEQRRRRRVPKSGSGAMSIVAMVAIVTTVVLTPVLWESETVVDLPPIVAQTPVISPAPEPLAPTAEALMSQTLEELELWTQSNALLYQHTSLYLRYREPSLVRTGLR